MIEMTVLRDHFIDLTKHGKTKYDHYSLSLDLPDDNYSITSAYGVYETFFGQPLRLAA